MIQLVMSLHIVLSVVRPPTHFASENASVRALMPVVLDSAIEGLSANRAAHRAMRKSHLFHAAAFAAVVFFLNG
jgi:hypothetical protein